VSSRCAGPRGHLVARRFLRASSWLRWIALSMMKRLPASLMGRTSLTMVWLVSKATASWRSASVPVIWRWLVSLSSVRVVLAAMALMPAPAMSFDSRLTTSSVVLTLNTLQPAGEGPRSAGAHVLGKGLADGRRELAVDHLELLDVRVVLEGLGDLQAVLGV